MFSKQERRDSNASTITSTPVAKKDDIPSIIASDLKIVGNLICGGSIEIEGEIEGNVTCQNVTIRRTGAINGDVTAEIIHIDGEISGLVKGKHITLSDSGRVTGVIMYESLSVKDGAYIDGQCKSADKAHSGAVEKLDLDNELIDDSSEGDETIEIANDSPKKVKAKKEAVTA